MPYNFNLAVKPHFHWGQQKGSAGFAGDGFTTFPDLDIFVPRSLIHRRIWISILSDNFLLSKFPCDLIFYLGMREITRIPFVFQGTFVASANRFEPCAINAGSAHLVGNALTLFTNAAVRIAPLDFTIACDRIRLEKRLQEGGTVGGVAAYWTFCVLSQMQWKRQR